jgi:cytidylate kinase
VAHGHLVVALDGPSGAGKSTIAKRIAGRFNLTYLDTGAMYRAVGYLADRAGIAFDDDVRMAALLAKISMSFIRDGEIQRLIVNGEDLSEKIRDHRVSKLASDVSARRIVRVRLVELQREIGSRSPSILDGRDIGTHVFPTAQVKIYLTAELRERALRRFKELTAKGVEVPPLERLAEDIRLRDEADMKREFAPLMKASDAIEIDSSKMSIDDVVEQIAGIIEASGQGAILSDRRGVSR